MLRNFSLAWINLRAEIKLRPTRNSVSMHSSFLLRDAKRKLMLISEIADPPRGIRKHGDTDSLMALTTRRKECCTIWSNAFWSWADIPNDSALTLIKISKWAPTVLTMIVWWPSKDIFSLSSLSNVSESLSISYAISLAKTGRPRFEADLDGESRNSLEFDLIRVLHLQSMLSFLKSMT